MNLAEVEGKPARHIVNLSGGKDSTALAIFMRDKLPEMEYVFCDTGSELRETYEYLEKIERFLDKPIVRLNSGKPFDYWLEMYSSFLPSAKSRWCTRVMKIVPFEQYAGDDLVYSYIGIRADEDRTGYISSKPNITPVYPFKEAGIVEADVYELLRKSGLGLPDYYRWRSRSGCYFCFFQRRVEWVGLLENHPDLFYRAKTYEKPAPSQNEHGFTWIPELSLIQIERNKDEIKRKAALADAAAHEKKRRTLFELFAQESELSENESGENPCLMCDL